MSLSVRVRDTKGHKASIYETITRRDLCIYIVQRLSNLSIAYRLARTFILTNLVDARCIERSESTDLNRREIFCRDSYRLLVDRLKLSASF